MSATGRGAERVELDFYRTPQWCVDAIVPHLPKTGIVLEPGCGDGAILEALLGHPYKLIGVELDPTRAAKARCITPAIWEGDFLTMPDEPMCHLVIGNPPYSMAEDFVRKSLKMVRRDGVVAQLLRLNWLSGVERSKFHREHPAEVFVLPRRPSFCAALKCSMKEPKCSWRVTQSVDAPRPKRCPECGIGDVTCTTTDATEYAWFLWGTAKPGHWHIL